MAGVKIDISDHVTIEEAIDIALGTPVHVPVMFWGQPGIGKTKALNARFRQAGYENVYTVLAGCSEPTDLSGIPFPSKENDSAIYLPPWWAHECSIDGKNTDPALILFDDIVTAHEQTQAAFYRGVHERYFGDKKLRDNVKIMAAGNRIDDKSAVVDMPLALANRFLHIYVKPDTDAWIKWAVKSGIYPTIVAYIRSQSHRLTTFDDAKVSSEKAFATPRSWEMLSDCLFAAKEKDLDKGYHDYTFKMASGAVGKGVATEFIAFMDNTEGIVPPEEIVKNPRKAKVHDAKEIDLAFATISNLEYWVRKEVNWKHWKAVLIYSMRVPAEIGMLLARTVITLILDDFKDEEKAKACVAEEFIEAYEKFYDRMGIASGGE